MNPRRMAGVVWPGSKGGIGKRIAEPYSRREGRRFRIVSPALATRAAPLKENPMKRQLVLVSLVLMIVLAATSAQATNVQAGVGEPECNYSVHFKATVTKQNSKRTFRTYYNSDCTTTTVETALGDTGATVDDRTYSSSTVAPQKKVSKSLQDLPRINSVIFPPSGAGSGTCVAIQTLRDPVGIPETEIRNKHWFAWGDTMSITPR